MFNKLVIFDLDGVLIDSKELHYKSLNYALEKLDKRFVISLEEHLKTYDGLSTSRKLDLLTLNKALPRDQHNTIWEDKQKATWFLLGQLIKIDSKIIEICKKLKLLDYKIAVASNSVRDTIKIAINNLGISQYVDYVASNEDVIKAKPYPYIYWKCMEALVASPDTTLIIEDSHIGRTAVLHSKAHLLPVKNPTEVTWETIDLKLNEIEKMKNKTAPWKDNTLNILIPMAGAGSRFAQAGYTFPKPLIDIRGKSMIEVVCDNLNLQGNYIFVVQKDHYNKFNLKHFLNLLRSDSKIIVIDSLTEGAACTTLLAKEYINNENPLVIANSDQFIEWNANETMYSLYNDNVDGGILTFKSRHPKWSYASVNSDGFVAEVAEKKVISDNATVGIYYWKQGKDYVKYAEQMIAKNIRVNNEFYVCPVFNEAIKDHKRFKIKEVEKMWGLGTPEDLEIFLKEYNHG